MKKKNNMLVSLLMIVGALITVVFPIYLTILIALKSPQDMIPSALSIPGKLHFENFGEAIKLTDFFSALKNSAVITIGVLVLTLIFNSLVSYAIARNRNKKFFNALYYYFLSAMFVPFPIIMLPLVKLVSRLNMDNIPGIILLYVVFGLPQNIFLYTGYIKSIPISLEESAIIDGASVFKIFSKVIFPLLKPINATVVITTSLWTWNDFLLPLVILGKPELQTLPLVQYVFQSQFSTNYNLAFASYILALLPILIVYIFAQKWIRNGAVAGAVK